MRMFYKDGPNGQSGSNTLQSGNNTATVHGGGNVTIKQDSSITIKGSGVTITIDRNARPDNRVSYPEEEGPLRHIFNKTVEKKN